MPRAAWVSLDPNPFFLMKIAPMPQGDIRAKQQRLSGHRWVMGFDFAAGFYPVTVALSPGHIQRSTWKDEGTSGINECRLD